MHTPATSPSAVLLVAFGTTLDRAWVAYDAVEAHIRHRFPDAIIRWAFTSSFVRRKLIVEGKPAKSPDEAIECLEEQGFLSVAVQSLHVVPGEQHRLVEELTAVDLDYAVGAPLLASADDLERVATLLEAQAKADIPNVVVCHGNNRHLDWNDPYLELAQRLRASSKPFYVGSLEGVPGIEPVLKAKAAARARGAVHFLPLLVAAGGHMQFDVLGERPDSWRQVIGVERVTAGPPIGQQPAMLDIYADHLRTAMRQLG